MDINVKWSLIFVFALISFIRSKEVDLKSPSMEERFWASQSEVGKAGGGLRRAGRWSKGGEQAMTKQCFHRERSPSHTTQ